MKEFLTSPEVRVSLHGSKVTNPKDNFNFEFDIDGGVLELVPVPSRKAYIIFLPELQHHIQRHCCLLKKPVKFTIWQNLGEKLLWVCFGSGTCGYFLNFTAFPEDLKKPSQTQLKRWCWICSLHLPTMKKQHLSRMEWLYVVLQGLSFVLRLVLSSSRVSRRWPLHPHHNHKVWAKNGQGLFSLTLPTLTSSNQLPFTLESPSIYSLQGYQCADQPEVKLQVSPTHPNYTRRARLHISCMWTTSVLIQASFLRFQIWEGD